jgi:hypothetical protein
MTRQPEVRIEAAEATGEGEDISEVEETTTERSFLLTPKNKS